jgi:hypothetical protein
MECVETCMTRCCCEVHVMSLVSEKVFIAGKNEVKLRLLRLFRVGCDCQKYVQKRKSVDTCEIRTHEGIAHGLSRAAP